MIDDICKASSLTFKCKLFGGVKRITTLNLFGGNATVPTSLTKLDMLMDLTIDWGVVQPFFVPWDALYGLAYLESLQLGCGFDFRSGNLNGALPSLLNLALHPSVPTPIPTQIIADNLGSISLSKSLTGSFPVIKSNSIVRIDISGTTLSGTIPWELGDLTTLLTMTISENNQLTGTIPWEIGCTRSPLGYLAITNNPGLTGTIPPEFGLLSFMEILQLTSNNLIGTIPMELSFNVSRYDPRYLWCYDDPPNLNVADNVLKMVDIRNNNLTGTIPSEFGNLHVNTFNVGNNKLTGSIPAEFFKNTELEWLDLSNNNFTGTVPMEIQYTRKLHTLILDNNNFVGTIPPEFYASRTISVQTFSIQHTKIEGTIPKEIGSIFIRGVYDVRDSLMSGKLPAEICNASITVLNLGSNFWGCWYNCTGLREVSNCDAEGSVFGCYGDCASPILCKSSCNDKYNNIPYVPSNDSLPSPPSTLTPGNGSIHSPSSLVMVIYRELYLKNLMTSLTSYFSNLTLSEGRILRIQYFVSLRYTLFEILGNLTSGGSWSSEGSTIVIGANGTLIVGNWTDVQSTIQTNGTLIVSSLRLDTSKIIVDNFADLDSVLSTNSVFELTGGTLILNDFQGANNVILYHENSTLIFRGCADLSNTSLVIAVSSTDNPVELVILYSKKDCTAPFKSVSGKTERDCVIPNVLQHYNNSMIWVTYELDDSNCNFRLSGYGIALIVIAIVLAIAGSIFCYFAHKNGKLRKFLFPYKDAERYTNSFKRDSPSL